MTFHVSAKYFDLFKDKITADTQNFVLEPIQGC